MSEKRVPRSLEVLKEEINKTYREIKAAEEEARKNHWTKLTQYISSLPEEQRIEAIRILAEQRTRK